MIFPGTQTQYTNLSVYRKRLTLNRLIADHIKNVDVMGFLLTLTQVC